MAQRIHYTRSRLKGKTTRKLNGWFEDWWNKSPSSPDPATYAGFDPDIDDWGCDVWMQYHRNLKNTFGADQARQIFLADWDRTHWMADNKNCRYDCTFVDYFQAEFDEDVGSFFTDLLCATEDLTTGVGDVAGGVAGGLKLSSYLLPFVVVGVGGYLLYESFEDRRAKRKKK